MDAYNIFMKKSYNEIMVMTDDEKKNYLGNIIADSVGSATTAFVEWLNHVADNLLFTTGSKNSGEKAMAFYTDSDGNRDKDVYQQRNVSVKALTEFIKAYNQIEGLRTELERKNKEMEGLERKVELLESYAALEKHFIAIEGEDAKKAPE